MELFQKAKVAIHTMKAEHFGIAIVELMSSGIITIAHNSAGPKGDIIGPAKDPVGYLAEGLDDYSFLVKKSFVDWDDDHHKKMRESAREWVVDQFGLDAFDHGFVT